MQENLYDSYYIADCIAVTALYVPYLRNEIHAFAKQWNVHTIRPQPRRPTVVTGQPWMLYNHPPFGAQNHGFKVHEDVLQTMLDDFEEWG